MDISKKPGGLLGFRHVQYSLMIVATVLGYGMRTVLNVAIVAMVDEHPPKDRYYSVYPEWKPKKNLILSSFFWGYVCLQVGAGQLAKKYGTRLFLLGSILIPSVAGVLLPLAGAELGYIGVIICRIVQGLAQGALVPSIHALLSEWAPVSERAKWGGFVYAGQALGNVFAMPITGAIAATKVGWPLVFYLYGGIGLLWSILWLSLGSDSPSKSKRISDTERKWIEASRVNIEEKSDVPTPWKAIFTSPPFLAILLAHCGQNWGFWTLLTEMPSFMREILKYKIDSNSFMSALPYFVMWVLSFFMSPIADQLVERKIVSLRTSRKIFNTIGFVIPGVALLSLNIVDGHNKSAIIAILVIGVGMNAGHFCGFLVNHIDISPNHAGTLAAITNSTASVFSIFAPLAVDLIKHVTGSKEDDKQLWNIVFSIAGGVYLITAVIFIIFASGDIQPWNGNNEISAIKDAKIEEKKRLGILRKISTSMAA
ncbi:unnamed protein product [Phaedon cochleariae]|uniref:Putative inorganic phosphate cotransporter n=1 Tax=Phaedon cochleariae TaxID=80249 RepID=A0A9P0DRA5_PHACE|nr:unnamed protein product [Phaedon cochleariae]